VDEAGVIAATDAPVTTGSLLRDLRTLGVSEGDVVIAHVAMSKLGWVVGGAQAVVEALLAAVGPDGTLVMPTQSGHLSDPARWQAPPVPDAWIDVIRRDMPLFDAALTPTRAMGQVVDSFRGHPGAVRSHHPTTSFAACGPMASALMVDHPLTPGLGEGSPLSRLYDADAQVLLLGVDHGNDTSLHLAEHRATWPGKRTYVDGAAMLVDGIKGWVSYEDLDLDDGDFAAIGDAFAATGGESEGPVGTGRGRRCRQRAIVDFAVSHITANRQ
jgi:aminoglycoside 3-N-acetyltransferase